jgi:hypothetical protein
MKSSRSDVINALALGWLVLVIWCVVLFWVRTDTWMAFTGGFPIAAGGQCPSGLVPEQLEEDPNVVSHSRAWVGSHCRGLETLWLWDLGRQAGWNEGPRDWPIESVIHDGKAGWARVVYWDERLGLFVYRVISYAGPNGLTLQDHLYAGPEGISEDPNRPLGRFTRPVSPYGSNPSPWRGIVYDRGSRQFYRIDWDNKKVLHGPATGPGFEPILMGPWASMGGISLEWSPPRRKALEGETSGRGTEWVPIEPNMDTYPIRQVMVLDPEGQIFRLDPETLTVSTPIGHLPAAGPRSSGRPRDLLAYGMRSVEIRGQYAGCVTGAVAAEGTVVDMAVFDKDGHLVRSEYSRPDRVSPLAGHPGAYGALASQYLLETLHPLCLSLLSRGIGFQVEALAGQRGFFVLPNSFMATRAREATSYPLDRLFWVVVMLLPSLALAAFLAWRVARDARVIGLPKAAIRWWIAAVAAFGLPAYLTYRLARPQDSLVTCLNCGNPRRPDMDRCHRCGAPWQVPELVAPSWRVMD